MPDSFFKAELAFHFLAITTAFPTQLARSSRFGIRGDFDGSGSATIIVFDEGIANYYQK
jgi:hypothetical protein